MYEKLREYKNRSNRLLSQINLQDGVCEQPIIVEWTSRDLQLDPKRTEHKED